MAAPNTQKRRETLENVQGQGQSVQMHGLCVPFIIILFIYARPTDSGLELGTGNQLTGAFEKVNM